MTVAPVTMAPTVLATGAGSPVTIDFVDIGRAPVTLAVGRDLLARPHNDAVAGPRPCRDVDVCRRAPRARSWAAARCPARGHHLAASGQCLSHGH